MTSPTSPRAEPRTDPRAERTRTRLRQSLIDLCAQNPLEDLSVATVVRAAGVGRATFYLHYTDLQALAVDASAEPVRQAVEALHSWRGAPDPASPPAALTAFFTEAAANATLYRSLLHPGGTGPLGELLHRELRERSRAERALVGAPAPELFASAVSAAFAGVLADWLHGLIAADPVSVAGHIWRLLIALHQTPLT